MRRVSVSAGDRGFIPLAQIRGQFFIRDVQRQVRQRGGEVQEESAIPVLADESQGRINHPVRGVVRSLERGVGGGIAGIGPRGQLGTAGHRRIVVQFHFLAVSPQVAGIVAVGVALAVVAEEQVKALGAGITGGAHVPQTPLADRRGRVALSFEQLGDGHLGCGDRLLAGRLPSVLLPEVIQPSRRQVAANVGMPGMLAGHQATPRGGADCVTAVVLRKAHPFRGQAVDVRRPDLLLAVAAQLRVAEVIGENVDDVRRLRGGGRSRHGQSGGHTEEQQRYVSIGHDHHLFTRESGLGAFGFGGAPAIDAPAGERSPCRDLRCVARQPAAPSYRMRQVNGPRPFFQADLPRNQPERSTRRNARMVCCRQPGLSHGCRFRSREDRRRKYK